MKKALLAAAMLVSGTWAQQAGIVLGGASALRIEPVVGVPYSAESITEASQPMADGIRSTRTTVTRVYRDSEGRERREPALDPQTGRDDQSNAPTIAIFDPVAGATYMLDVLRHTALRLPLPRPAPPNPIPNGTGFAPSIQFTPFQGPSVQGGAAPGAQIPQIAIQQGAHVEITAPGVVAGPIATPSANPAGPRVERLEPRTIDGLKAEGTRTTETIPAVAGNPKAFDVVTETWFSPDLKIDLMTRHSDPRIGETTTRLTKIDRSKPDPALFQVPSDYAVQDMPSFSGGIVPGTVR